jgi:hypothetical protein
MRDATAIEKRERKNREDEKKDLGDDSYHSWGGRRVFKRNATPANFVAMKCPWPALLCSVLLR